MTCFYANECKLYSETSLICNASPDQYKTCETYLNRIGMLDHHKKKEKNTMKKENKVQEHADICQELTKLYERKNHDYGDSFHQTFLEEGMAMARIRLGDKFNRFKALSKGTEQKVSDESMRDTLIDLANYAIMTIMEMDMKHE